jgi:hypothetical protein
MKSTDSFEIYKRTLLEYIHELKRKLARAETALADAEFFQNDIANSPALTFIEKHPGGANAGRQGSVKPQGLFALVSTYSSNYNKDANPEKKVLYLIKSLNRAVKISFIKSIIEELEPENEFKKTTASLNYVFDKLVKSGILLKVIYGGSKHHVFYGLAEWKSNEKGQPFLTEKLPLESDFGILIDKKQFEWLKSTALTSKND